LGRIFISHSSANNAEALAISDWLAENGWTDVFLDLDPRRGLVAGDRWQAALKAAAEQCELILILISPDWAKSKWCLAEFLLAKQMNKQILGIVVEATPLGELPVELTAEWQLVDLSAPDAGWSVTLAPPRHEPETLVSFSATGLARLRSGLEKAGLDATTFHWPPDDDPGRAPYRGLLPLEDDDAGIFFGRDGAVVLTLDRLRGLRDAAPPRFVTILGASGAGKSSFLRAGLLPRLDRDSRHFYVLPILRPERAALTGEHGFAAMLDAALKARGITRNRADLRAAVLAGADAVRPILRELAIPADAGDLKDGAPPMLVVSVDQAEELLAADSAETGPFLTLLAELARSDDPALLVIFTVRSDSFDQLQARPELAGTQPHHLVDLPPIPAGAFGEIIRGPARRISATGRKLSIDETLVDALLADIESGGTKDALPLLAFTLERLYTDYGADGDLQLGEYERLGRIRGAIEAAVEEALARADGNAAIPRDRAARLALLRRGLIPWLAGIDPATGAPRRRVARMAEVPEEARPLIELMVEQRLLATDIDSATRERTIEPAHEALLRQWGALDGWLVEDSADLTSLEALRRAASEWDANARASEFLVHRGARLAAVEPLAADPRYASYLTSIDAAYLSAARNVENEAVRKARAARTRWGIAAALAGIVLVAGATAGWFTWQAAEAAKIEAEVSFRTAQAEAALRAGRPEDGAAAALAAYAALPTPATRTKALEAAMAISPNALGRIPVEGRVVDARWLDATHAAVLGADRTLILFDTATRRSTATPLAETVQPAGLLPDGAGGALILNSDTSIARADGSLFAAPTQEPFFLRAGTLSASADGKMLLLIGLTGEALVRDCRTLPCADTLVATPNWINAGALKADGSGFALGTEANGIEIYADASAPPLVARIETQPASGVGALAWDESSGRLVVEMRDVGLWALDPQTGASAPINADLPISALAAAPDGLLALGCDRGTLCLFGADGMRRGAIAAHTGPVAGLRWAPDGRSLLSMAPNEPVRLWSRAEDQQVNFGLASDNWTALTTLAVDRTRQLVAAGDELGYVHMWRDGVHTTSYPAAPARVTALAFLSDGRLAAVYENAGIAILTFGDAAHDTYIPIDNASFSRIAALSGDIRAAVPLTDGRVIVLSGDALRLAELPRDDAGLTPWGLTAAPAANAAFISYSDGSIRRRDLGAGGQGAVVFDASQPLCGAAPSSDNNGAKSLDVSPDGKWLVATRADAAVIVHNLADPTKPLCLALPAPDSKTVAFSPDSRRLAILSATDRLYVFDLGQPDTALIFGAPAVPDTSPLAMAAGSARTTSWLAWRDERTIVVSTTAGAVENIVLDPVGWQARVDSLAVAQ
jgi:WD40 repeat protein